MSKEGIKSVLIEIDDFKDDDNREDAVYEKLSMVYNKNLILNHYIVVCTKDKIPLLLSKGKEIERRNQEKIIHAPSLYWIILLDEDMDIDRLMPLSSNVDINQEETVAVVKPNFECIWRQSITES